uniref:Cellular repressor of E1A stimulateds 2 n=1 Tax=Serinus canaria TaxID=9135 RepID=A0A8C9MES4_SERCA
ECSHGHSPSWIVSSLMNGEVAPPLDSSSWFCDACRELITRDSVESLIREIPQSYPASAYREDAALGSGPAARRPGQGAAPSRMFSYRREGGAAPGRAGTARFLAQHNTWGFVATRAARGKIQGMPYGNCLLLSDGPINNSTGIPFFYVTPKDNTVTDLLKNPMASLTLPEADGNFCRKNVIDPEDPRCARLTLTGQMVTVPPEEVEFAKQAMFSRHPVVRKWPRSYEWFFMKMNIEHIWLQSWYGEVSPIAVEEYLKAAPNKG